MREISEGEAEDLEVRFSDAKVRFRHEDSGAQVWWPKFCSRHLQSPKWRTCTNQNEQNPVPVRHDCDEITVPCRTASMPFKGRSRCCGGLFLYRRPALAEGRAFLLLVGAEQSRQACGLNVPCPLLIYNPNSVETGGVVCRFMHERLQHCMPWFVRSCRMSRRNESQD